MNAEKIQHLLAPFWRTDDGRTAVERAKAFGIDLSLIEENLRLTPEQRIRQNDLVLTEAEDLIEARERTHPNHKTTR